LDFFLSFHHEDDKLAGKVKIEVERQGSTAFLAHKDIEISKTWREEILSNLKACQALIAIVTPNFTQSSYANQEVGFVMGKGKPVISLNFMKDLPGFLESLQAVHASEANLGASVEKAIKVIQGRDPSIYIEPAFKSALEIEDIAVNEIYRHLQRQSYRIQIHDVEVGEVILKEDSGLFTLAGIAITGVVGSTRTYWQWHMVMDARTGRILSKTLAKTGTDHDSVTIG